MSNSGTFGIVLGEQLRRDGELVPEFMIRLNHAAGEWKKGKFEKFLLTGGETAPGRPTEADMAHDWLVQYHGVPTCDIVLEKKSRTTSQNINFAAPILKEHNAVQVFIYGRRSQRLKTRVFVRHFWPSHLLVEFESCTDHKRLGFRLVDQTIMVALAYLDPDEHWIAKWLNRAVRHFFVHPT